MTTNDPRDPFGIGAFIADFKRRNDAADRIAPQGLAPNGISGTEMQASRIVDTPHGLPYPGSVPAAARRETSFESKPFAVAAEDELPLPLPYVAPASTCISPLTPDADLPSALVLHFTSTLGNAPYDVSVTHSGDHTYTGTNPDAFGNNIPYTLTGLYGTNLEQQNSIAWLVDIGNANVDKYSEFQYVSDCLIDTYSQFVGAAYGEQLTVGLPS